MDKELVNEAEFKIVMFVVGVVAEAIGNDIAGRDRTRKERAKDLETEAVSSSSTLM